MPVGSIYKAGECHGIKFHDTDRAELPKGHRVRLDGSALSVFFDPCGFRLLDIHTDGMLL